MDFKSLKKRAAVKGLLVGKGKHADHGRTHAHHVPVHSQGPHKQQHDPFLDDTSRLKRQVELLQVIATYLCVYFLCMSDGAGGNVVAVLTKLLHCCSFVL